jgi:hypothetical protein
VLEEIERALQEKHLQCCVFPRLKGAEEINNALVELSNKRIGALIAVEQKMNLDDYAKTGAVINAELKAELLLSLFYPGSPLHDGRSSYAKNKLLPEVVFCPSPPIMNFSSPWGSGQGTAPAWGSAK